MSLKILLEQKDAAVAADIKAEAEELAATAALGVAHLLHADTAEARAAAHKAIHDLLDDLGEHYTIDEDGTCTVYKPVEPFPGYLAVQPIPGDLSKG